ncbi:tandem-95 repeat protein [Rhodobacteraceae bacterium N5(2021)]|uniref:Tandem-95 repeat protein n=1 Tax=Gymnodinialimonas phycosphaerae TaxID=2841589 RepID=A0A975TYJ7_9RHOB|nr:Hint domain-containing protein [Gymnodinialimonas phycosphaerae]MBY4892336.1 tandem-95 repeat protein [Gymnodinialimonas phycosphaerae]
MTNFNEPSNVADLIGLWDFLSGNETADTGLDDGIAQNGNAVDGNGVSPSFSNDQLHVGGGSNSHPTVFDVNADSSSSADDEQFNLDRGTLEVQFTQSSHSGSSEDVILSRGEKHIDEDDEGFFEIRVTKDGSVQSYHNTDDGDHKATLCTSNGFFSPGDVINVKYSFDKDTGARLTVENLTTGAIESHVTDETGLTFDLTDNDDEEFTFGAREKDDGEYDKEFQGSIDYVALYTTTNDPVTNPLPEGEVVDGENFGEVMTPGYDDANAPTDGGGQTIDGADGDDDIIMGNGGDDTIDAGAGDDLISGGSGDDEIDGSTGNDTIYGDQSSAVSGDGATREVFQWDLAPNTGAPNFSQDTGNVTVTFTEADGGASDDISTDTQNVAGIDTGTLGAVDATSSLDSETGCEGKSDTYKLDFSDPVENVSFRVNDIDGDGIVRIKAFDANGDPIEVILDGGDNLTLLDTDGVTGNDTADSNGGYLPDTSDEYSVLVTIPGPVSSIEIFHTQDGSNNSGINVTDVYFDTGGLVVDTGAPGNDDLDGGEGDDLIYGQDGDDTLTGGTGTDALFGDDGDDTFIVSSAEDGDGDTIDGGNGPDETTDNDVLDLRGAGVVTINDAADANDDGATAGTVTFEDGSVLTFEGIETILTDPTNEDPDAVDDANSGDEDTVITGNVLGNDTDPNAGDTLEVISNTDPSNGTVTVDANGDYTYTPNEDFNGVDSFTYTISDGNGGTDTATVTLAVDPVNDAPDAVNDAATTPEDTAITIDVLDNDTDVDGDTLEITGASVPSEQGTVAIVAGELLFTPAENFNGEATITYTISDGNGGTDTADIVVSVTPVNDDPDAVDDGDTTEFETAVEINLLANDSDVDNPASDLTVTSATVPASQGTLTPTGTEGVYTFTPAAGFEGTATVSYTISDGAGGTDSAVHTIEVGADPTPQDGIVDGEETGEEMVLGYDDSNLPTDQGGDIITDGDDTIEGNGGDDTINGAGGDDDIDGGTGADVIAGGEGDDTLSGGEGDDDIAVGGNDVADGGTGDDVFTVDATDPTVPNDVTIDGGSDGTDGNPDGPENGDEGDVLDLGDQTDDLTVEFGTNPEEGTVNGLDADDDDPADITFEEIEKVITGSGDDVIDGSDADEGIDVETGDGDDDVTGGDGDDTIDAGDGDDDVEAGDGDDSVTAGDGDDDVEGGAGDDTIDGGDGSDTLAGGEGDDVIDGGDGDDDIVVGAGDTADGGIGDDVFTVDPTLSGDSPITVDGGSDGTQPGDEAGPENGDDGDVLDLRGLDLVSLVYDETDPSYDPVLGVGEKGTAVYNNDNGDPVTIEFSEIEIVLNDPLPDGVVDGEETGELMNPGYDDGNLPTDNGGDIIDGPDGLDDVIEGNGGDDTINAGLGSDTVSGGTGDDEIFGGATDDGDDLSGDEGDDTLQGGGGDDTLDGGVGDDVIEGGTGDDDIIGGDGADSVDGGDGNDTIDTSGDNDLLDAGWPGYGPIPAVAPDGDPDDDKDTVNGGEGDDFITTGDDADVIDAGTGDDTVDAGIDDDSVLGGGGDDLLIGSEGNDTLSGGGGNDTIFGGLETPAPDGVDLADDGFGAPFGPDPDPLNNADSIEGGAGDDLIYGQDDADTITGGTGDDTIDGGVDDDSILGGQGDDVIEGGHGQDFIQGNIGDDEISGGRGSDTLEGNAGDDTIIGGAGDSIIGGGDADSIFIDQDEVDENGDNDTAIFVEGNTFGDDNDTLDLTDFVAHRNLVETPDGDGDSTSGSVEVQNDEGEWVEVTFGEIENLLLPPQAPDGVVDGEEFDEVMDPLYDDSNGPTDGGGDIIDGPDGDDDSIRGNGGDDTINAGEGDDTVDGGDDNDSVLGGNGDDIVMGGDGDDTVRGEEGDDTVSGGDGNDSVTGGAGDDVLDGGEGDDSLTGGSGDDTIDGGLGNDTITGSTGADSITDLDGDNEINSDNPGSFNPDLGVPIGTTGTGFIVTPGDDPDDNKDTITTGDGDDTINAGDDADLIDAGDGDNVIDGGTDADTITTGDGNDSIVGGEGDDLINSGDGDDTIDGGVGDPLANLIDDPNDGFFADPILNNGDDTINAGAGDDVVNGEDDNDLIDGGTGDDTLDGGIDDDTVLGGEGDDVIIGGQGGDSLDGGTGDDTFNVGTFTDPNGTGDYQEGVGDTIVGGEDADDLDEDVLDLTGSGSLKVVFDDAIDPTGTPGESGTVIFYTDDTQTEESGRLTFKEIENVIPCFTPGTMIATPRGEVPVETLREGDKVITRDNGIQEIRWTGNRTLNRTELAKGDNLKPILIKAGSLGRNLPERDMLVSPQHRVLITGETPQLYFEESEVLVAAKHLIGKQGVSVMDTMRTTYIHFMFDRHEVVLSDGAWTESFQPGDQSLGSMGEATREEIFALFPELATQGGLTDYAAARRSLKAHEAKLLRL